METLINYSLVPISGALSTLIYHHFINGVPFSQPTEEEIMEIINRSGKTYTVQIGNNWPGVFLAEYPEIKTREEAIEHFVNNQVNFRNVLYFMIPVLTLGINNLITDKNPGGKILKSSYTLGKTVRNGLGRIKSYLKGMQELKQKRKEEQEKYLKEVSLATLHKLLDCEIEFSIDEKVKLLEKLDTGIYGFCNGGKGLSVKSYAPSYKKLGDVINDVKKYHCGVETSVKNVEQMLNQKKINYRKDLLSLMVDTECDLNGGTYWGPVAVPVIKRTIEPLNKVLFVVEELLNSSSYRQQEKDLEQLEDKIKRGELK